MPRNAVKLIVLITLTIAFIYSYSDRAMAITIHYYSNRAVILMYHHFDDTETSVTINRQRFEEQLLYLQHKGYNFISLEQLTAFLENKGDIPPNAVVITFDDGYESTYKIAYPFMERKQIPATFFLITKHIGATQGEIPKLTWKEIREMYKHESDFQSHSYDSHKLISNSIGLQGEALTNRLYLPNERRYEHAYEYKKRIYNDLLTARTVLKDHLKNNVNTLALPYGAYNSLLQAIAGEAGYEYILTTEPGLVDKTSKPTALKRINAGQAGIDGETLHHLILQYGGIRQNIEECF